MKKAYVLLWLSLFAAALLIGNLFVGSTAVAPSDVIAALHGTADSTATFIVGETRMPQAVTALLAGGALAVAGLLMQTLFANPLADPSILGLNAGASLGVAVATLWLGGSVAAVGTTFSGSSLTLLTAFVGAGSIMALLVLCATWIHNRMLLLILGLMVSYAVSSLVSLLSFTADAAGLHAYVIWGLGSFGTATWQRLPLFATTVAVGVGLAALTIKALNALTLGEAYAANMGIRVRRMRILLMASAGLLSATVTAQCGPIAFIGLAVPHMARMLTRTADHRILLPATFLCGASVALACHMACRLPGDAGLLPLNTVTPLVGVPVVLYVILRRRGISS